MRTFFLILIALAAVGCAGAPEGPEVKGEVVPAVGEFVPAGIPIFAFGMIRDEETLEPIAGARITWRCGWCNWIDVDITDPNGFYIVSGGDHLGHHGDYIIEAPGYITQGMFINSLPASPFRADIMLTRDTTTPGAPDE